jgi:uncharacterized protein (TIGR02145 family)
MKTTNGMLVFKPLLLLLLTFLSPCIYAQTLGSFTDARDGHVYKTVTIGNDVWMAENLAFKLENGCWAYGNEEGNVKTYGYLYNWISAVQACPKGWHLPSNQEWDALTKTLGGVEASGPKLKVTTGWLKDKNSTNESGFTALPGGARHWDGSFYGIGSSGSWWGSVEAPFDEDDEDAIEEASQHSLYAFGIMMNWSGFESQTRGFSVRCVKD